MKTVKIKGKEYVEVKERVRYLRDEYPHNYEIKTDYQYFPDSRTWVVRAVLAIHTDNGTRVYTGLAQERESDKYSSVNFASALENAETSAVGRACAFAGIGLIDTIRSADEVVKSDNKRSGAPITKDQKNKIWELLDTAAISEDMRDGIREGMADFSEVRADECINWLTAHQADVVRDNGGQARMKDVKKSLENAVKDEKR